MALIIFSFLPETPKSSLCVTFCYMAILNFQYNQLDMLYFSILLHHRRVGVEIVDCTHPFMMSIYLEILKVLLQTHLSLQDRIRSLPFFMST